LKIKNRKIKKEMKDILIFGAGTMVNTYADAVLSTKEYNIVGLIDDRYPSIKEAYGFKVVGNTDSLKHLNVQNIVVCIGDNYIRKKVVNKIEEIIPDINFPIIIHNRAYVSDNAVLGKGVVIQPNTVIDAGCLIKNFCWIGMNSVVPHNGILQDYSSISAGVTVGGEFKLGKYSYMGIGSTATHCISIGDNTVIGAGSVVLKNIPKNCVACNIPCKILKKRKLGEKYL
jgi:sugar O-acyltransferase (sialic acid O-acetyltransferase NeuD family)